MNKDEDTKDEKLHKWINELADEIHKQESNDLDIRLCCGGRLRRYKNLNDTDEENNYD